MAPSPAFLVLGRSGAGKTTLTQCCGADISAESERACRDPARGATHSIVTREAIANHKFIDGPGFADGDVPLQEWFATLIAHLREENILVAGVIIVVNGTDVNVCSNGAHQALEVMNVLFNNEIHWQKVMVVATRKDYFGEEEDPEDPRCPVRLNTLERYQATPGFEQLENFFCVGLGRKSLTRPVDLRGLLGALDRLTEEYEYFASEFSTVCPDAIDNIGASFKYDRATFVKVAYKKLRDCWLRFGEFGLQPLVQAVLNNVVANDNNRHLVENNYEAHLRQCLSQSPYNENLANEIFEVWDRERAQAVALLEQRLPELRAFRCQPGVPASTRSRMPVFGVGAAGGTVGTAAGVGALSAESFAVITTAAAATGVGLMVGGVVVGAGLVVVSRWDKENVATRVAESVSKAIRLQTAEAINNQERAALEELRAAGASGGGAAGGGGAGGGAAGGAAAGGRAAGGGGH